MRTKISTLNIWNPKVELKNLKNLILIYEINASGFETNKILSPAKNFLWKTMSTEEQNKHSVGAKKLPQDVITFFQNVKQMW